MNVFSAHTDVTLAVALVDRSGNPLEVASVRYRVTDGNGAVLVPITDLTSFEPGSESAEITIPAAINALADGALSALRAVELDCMIGVNSVAINDAYALQAGDPLAPGLNSFCTYAQAQFTALDMPNLDAWQGADERTRIAALIEARTHIIQLSFSQLNSNMNWGQDSLNFIPEGSYETNYAGDMFLFNGNLDLLPADQFVKLPLRFLTALKQAQLAEANAILGGDQIETRRAAGLIQDNVGESRQSFRNSKPLQLPVCRRALGYLSLYVSFAKRIGR